MHTSAVSSAVRTCTPGPLDELPADIFSRIVVNHISLREGRAMTSLACVSRAFAQRMKAHMAPLQLYRSLDNASQGVQAMALHGCMSTLYELARVNPSHRLELFLRVSATLHHHFPGDAIMPHADTLLTSLRHLERDEQPAALLSLLTTHRHELFCATKQRYLTMAVRIGALMPSIEQSRLASILGREMTSLSGQDFPEKAQAFLAMCMRLQTVHKIEAISYLLTLISTSGHGSFYPDFYRYPVDEQQLEDNKCVLLWGLHACLQSIPMQELPVDEQALLLGKALIMPVCFVDVEAGDKMAISLLRMISLANGDFYWMCNAESRHSFGDLIETTLQKTFERGPANSIHRFQCLYQAIAHLPPSWQNIWMRGILHKRARQAEAGVTPALIVATAEAALKLNQAQPECKMLYDLFALALNPARLRKVNFYPSVQPAEVNPADQPGYTQRFDAKCSELMHLLENVAPDMAGKLLVGINGAYQENRPLEDMLPPGSLFKAELYGRFLKQALAFLRSLPPADSAACLLQWRLPALHSTDVRHADDWTSSLMKAVADVSRGNDRVSVEQQTSALGDLLQNGINVTLHSPARNLRMLAGLAGFPDAVCAHVLVRLLENQSMCFTHYDVLFASTIEAARRLTDALRSVVLEAAVNGLMHFPDPWSMGITGSTLQQQRDDRLERDYPGLQQSDRNLYALMRPGHVSRMDGWALLLDAVQTLSFQNQADRLIQLCDDTIFFRFSKNRLSDQDRAQCSIRLLCAIIGLPHSLRGEAFFSWLRHADRQFYEPQECVSLEAAMLPLLLALPASEGKPLLNAYLPRVWPAEERVALQQRAALHWKDAV